MTVRPIVKLGCSAVLSGDEAIHGRSIVRAVQLAVERANSRVRAPFEFRAVPADDRAEGEGGVRVAGAFIDDPEILGVIGPMTSDPAAAAAPVYDRAGLAHISPSASSPALTRRGYRTFFRLVPDDLVQGSVAARYAVRALGALDLAVIHDGSAFGEPLAEVFRETAAGLGARIRAYEAIRRRDVDYGSVADRVQDARADLFFFGVIEAEGTRLAAQLRDRGVRAIFFGTDGLKASRFLETPGAGVDGPYHTNSSTDIHVKPSAAGFLSLYRERYGEDNPVYAAEAYDAANILISAVEGAPVRTGATRPDRASVLAGVAGTREYSGASGTITFDEKGDRTDPEIGIYKVDDGRIRFLGYDWELLGPPD
ncbi:MAG: branched-chain amino acid ABC transporter substrate-binding protein [Actinobacteria bacterium]|nr:branched-chain amino acid ABC transporter substrate-binding protein [Actinomycetota bacterium]